MYSLKQISAKPDSPIFALLFIRVYFCLPSIYTFYNFPCMHTLLKLPHVQQDTKKKIYVLPTPCICVFECLSDKTAMISPQNINWLFHTQDGVYLLHVTNSNLWTQLMSAVVFKGFTNHVTCNITCSVFFYMQMQSSQHCLYNDLNFELKFVILPYSNRLYQCFSKWANGHPCVHTKFLRGYRKVTKNYRTTVNSEHATENSLHE